MIELFDVIEEIEAILEKPYAAQYLEGLAASEEEWSELNESKRGQIALLEEYFDMCQDPPPQLLKALEKARKSHEGCTWEDALELMGFTTNIDEEELENLLLNRFVNHG